MDQATISLADQAYSLIEEMIVTLELAPGSVFSENDLSKRIEIGRTPMREALQRLSSERLLKAMPRRGMLVTEINIADHFKILDTRRVLDRLLATRAARRVDDGSKADLRGIARKMQEAAEEKDLNAFMRHDRELDETLALIANNPYAAQAAACMHAHCRRFWYQYRGAGDLVRSGQLHAALVDAVLEGDEEAAAACSDQLIDYLVEFTNAALTH
ncbi:MAG: GntR family transcriptional regulator [Acidobacteriota bacterium]|nr:GntR family transcriptional regulator [Acidobacteriota bacterium]